MANERSILCGDVTGEALPFDKKKPAVTSGIRLGTPAVTTRGMKESEMKEIGDVINLSLTNKGNSSILEECNKKVGSLVKRFPLYTN